MDKELKDKLRLFKVDVLAFLSVLAGTDAIALDVTEISQSTSTPDTDLRGLVGTIRRIKVKNESLILPAGRDMKGRLRWQINAAVVAKKELSKFLDEEILGKEGLTIAK